MASINNTERVNFGKGFALTEIISDATGQKIYQARPLKENPAAYEQAWLIKRTTIVIDGNNQTITEEWGREATTKRTACAWTERASLDYYFPEP